MSVIKISCVDQALTFTNTPIIASGGLNEDQVEFTFCSLWTGYTKMAVFTKKENIYYVTIGANNQAIVPNGILSSNGRFYIGVVGYNGGVRRTSEMLPYTVVDGAVSPSPEPDTDTDVFAQMLSLVTEARDIATQTAERQEEFEKEISADIGEMTIPDGSVTAAKLAPGAAAKVSKMTTATLAAASWSSGKYTLSVSGVTTTSPVEILPGASITADQLTALQAANIQDGGQSANSITLKAFGDVPTIAIPIRIIVRGDM